MTSRMCVMLAAAFAFLGVAAPPTQGDPYAMFNWTQEEWALQKYPTNLSYDVVVQVVDQGKPLTERYATTYDAMKGTIHVNPISDFERAHPPDGRGVNIFFLTKQLNKSTRPIDFMGVPILEPTYSFGIGPHVLARKATSQEIVNEIRRQYHDTARPDNSGLKTIARLVSTNHAYAITYAGRESVRGVDCDHLSLRPTRDPGRNRLRELWIDHATHRTVRAIIGLNFIRGLGTKVPWRIDFGMHAGALYIASETALAPVHTEASLGGESSRTYTVATIAFENLHTQKAFSHLPSFFEPPADGALLREPDDVGDGIRKENGGARPI